MDEEKRLIIIDDEVSVLDLLQDQLEPYGLTVFTYESIPDLEKEFREKQPNAVLLDIVMPELSGVEILKRIKSINRRVPVIIMTGHADEEKRIEVLRNGAYTLLTKPFFSFEELYHTIDNAMNHYLESLKAEALAKEVQERYKRERINTLELEFLKSLQHMIGEAEENVPVLKSVFTLLKEFLKFDYFAALLFKDEETHIEVYDTVDGLGKGHERIVSALLKRIPASNVTKGKENIVEEWTVQPPTLPDNDGLQAFVMELSAADTIYGYTGIFKAEPFSGEEVLIFSRFCSHIALALEKIRLFNEIKTLSIHDGLTGVFNHAHAMREMEDEMQRAVRYNAPFSLIMLDVDDFKKVNDTYGHLAGDYVLKTMAQLMGKSLRTIDLVGRYGGEEFIVILPGTDTEKAFVAAERMRGAIEQERFAFESKNIQLTASIGVATYSDGMGVQDMIKRADDNLLKAKARGKNRICNE